jgi:hypothetical protein
MDGSLLHFVQAAYATPTGRSHLPPGIERIKVLSGRTCRAYGEPIFVTD